ncbi:MAG: sulfite exporter TauE/SafE family protein [Holophagales bacterium]|nr:MAG: sulfite exporter TauE/SafE family protein [Holophagales bacterium]
MSNELLLLMATAASIGVVHTLLGPDHYVPFIVLAKARGWSLARTAGITVLCGLGHVLSSVVLGMAGIALGLAVHRLEAVESTRGEIAGWALIALGAVYTAWGIKKAFSGGHGHVHLGSGHASVHALTHAHEHGGKAEAEAARRAPVTPWALFIVFVLGPCEPLIPILMYPAAAQSAFGMVAVTVVFAATTLAAMLAVTLAGVKGLALLPVHHLERFAHALAGAAILACGVAIKFLGL